LKGPDDFKKLAISKANPHSYFSYKVSRYIIDGLYTVYDRAERTIARGWKEIGL